MPRDSFVAVLIRERIPRQGAITASFVALTFFTPMVSAANGACGQVTEGGDLSKSNESAGNSSGCFYDIDEKWKSVHGEYKHRLDSRDPFHLLTIGELTIILGAAITWYAADRERNLADWDNPSWDQRFTLEAWKFDNNEFPINFLGHPINGSLFYMFPRANDHSVWVSSGYAFLTSFVWEFFAEFKEKVSVNDLVVTWGAGVTMGEFAHKFGRYFAGKSEDSGAAQDLANATLGFPVSLRRLLSGKPQFAEGPYDKFGFSNHIGPRLQAGYIYRHYSHESGEAFTHGARVGGRLTSIPGEGRPGQFSLFFHDADITELWMAFGGGTQAREFELVSDTQLLGVYAQSIGLGGHGVSGSVSLDLGYHYLFRDFQQYNDRLGIVHLPALGTEFRSTSKGVAFSSYFRFNPDFAGLHAPSYREWETVEYDPNKTIKSILRKHGYYYAWGVSSRVGMKLEVGPFDFSADLDIGTYNSQEGMDRTQEDVTDDVELRDSIRQFDVQANFHLPNTPLVLGLGYSTVDRKSRIGNYYSDRYLHTTNATISFVR